MSVVIEQAQQDISMPQSQKKLKFLVFPLGYVLAHVGRTVEIAKVLRNRGHEVVFAGSDPDHPQSKLDHAVAAGFRVVRVREPRWDYAWNRFQKYGGWIGVLDFFRSQKWAPLDLILEDIIRVCHEEKPDLLLGDSSVGVSTVGHILGLPAAGVMNSYNGNFFRQGSFYRFLINNWDRFYLSRIRARIYSKYGVEPANAIDLLKSMPILSPDLPLFHNPQGEYPNWIPIGPIISEPPCKLPDWYQELDDGKTNIYITMGSTGLLDNLLRRSYDVLGKSPYRFVVTTGGQAEPETMAMAPPNFRFTTYAPGSKLMERCKAVVFHGGNGTMYQALAAGLPMVALPSHLEQEECVKILLQQNFGIRCCSRKITGESLLETIEAVLMNPSYGQATSSFRDVVRHARATERAASLLIQHAQGYSIQEATADAESANVLYFPGVKA